MCHWSAVGSSIALTRHLFNQLVHNFNHYKCIPYIEFAYMALLTDLCNSFYLESKLPALSSTLYLTLMVTMTLFANKKGNYNVSLNSVFSKFERLKWIALFR